VPWGCDEKLLKVRDTHDLSYGQGVHQRQKSESEETVKEVCSYSGGVAWDLIMQNFKQVTFNYI
jgi:hypothetical protein